MTGKIFEIKRFAVHDGPGIRTTVFFKGCPLRCLWCHNPEGLNHKNEISVLSQKCIFCGACVQSCPLNLHKLENNIHLYGREGCTMCKKCISACLPEALKFYGEEYSSEALYEKVQVDRDFYYNSKGGVTCSGGEPLFQSFFLAEFLKICRDNMLHTAVDTSGYSSWESFLQVLNHCDLFLYDLKHMDREVHKELTGVYNDVILENLTRLSDAGKPVEVRVPVIPGLNDDDGNINATAGFLTGIKTLTLVRPLAYHALSGSKYESLGKKYNMPEDKGNSKERTAYAAAVFKSYGLSTA